MASLNWSQFSSIGYKCRSDENTKSQILFIDFVNLLYGEEKFCTISYCLLLQSVY